MKNYILILLSFMLVFAACEKDSIEEVTTGTETTLSGETVTANFKGQLLNNQGQIVEGAVVSIGTKRTTTNEAGIWSIDNAAVVKDQAYIQVFADNHHNGNRTLLVSENQTYDVDIQLISYTGGSTITPNGGTVDVPNSDAKVEFPSNAFANADGTPYTGIATVEVAYLDPASTELGSLMPGDLRAIDAQDETQLLISYGMVTVELFDDAGNAINLAEGQQATLRMPISADAAATAPETIPLWFFDEAAAQWVEEGVATKEGNEYVGQVSHFTFWNVDLPVDLVRICGTIQFEGDDSTSNASNVGVAVNSLNWGSAFAYTNENGEFCGLVPADEALTLAVITECYEYTTAINIGPFSSDTDLGDLVFMNETSTLTTITGVAECNGAPVTMGAAVVEQNGRIVSFAQTEADGSFELTFLSCDQSDLSIRVYDDAAGQISDIIIETHAENIDLGTVEACVFDATQYFNMTGDLTASNDNCFFQYNPAIGSFVLSTFSADSIPLIYVGAIQGVMNQEITTGTYDLNASPNAVPGFNLYSNPNGRGILYNTQNATMVITEAPTNGSALVVGTIQSATYVSVDSTQGGVIDTLNLTFDFSAVVQ